MVYRQYSSRCRHAHGDSLAVWTTGILSRFSHAHCNCCMVYRHYSIRFLQAFFNSCMVYIPYSSRFLQASFNSCMFTDHIQARFVILTVTAGLHTIYKQVSPCFPWFLHGPETISNQVWPRILCLLHAQGGYSNFFPIRRLGPSICPSPQKNIRNFKHPKKIFEILTTPKNIPNSVPWP